jgi:hypothetical protein
MSYINLITSREHLLNPLSGSINGEEVTASPTSGKALVVLAALGGVFAFHLLTARSKSEAHRKKFKVIPADVIKNGAGEFVVFKSNRENLTPEEYAIAFKIFEKYSPAHCREGYEKREELILEELKKEIDPSCQITFIPRTLYDIIAIQKVLKEELVDPRSRLNREEEGTECQRFLRFKEAKFSSYGEAIILGAKSFDPRKDQEDDPELAGIAEKHKECPCKNNGVKSSAYASYLKKSTEHTAHKINEIFLEKITSTQMNFSELKEMTKKEIQAIKSKEIPNKNSILGNLQKVVSKILDGVVENALELECSEMALKNTFLFRGANIAHDSPFNLKQQKEQSLSYGTSIFAGIFKDEGATSMRYMHDEEAAFALHIPFDKIAGAPFHVKLEHPLEQLWGKGEWFHSRSKVSNAIQISANDVHGVASKEGFDVDHKYKKAEIISTLPIDELVEEIQHYYRNNLVKLK